MFARNRVRFGDEIVAVLLAREGLRGNLRRDAGLIELLDHEVPVSGNFVDGAEGPVVDWRPDWGPARRRTGAWITAAG